MLMYHRVGIARNDWEARYAIAPTRFEAHMEALARDGRHAVSVDALVAWLEGGAAPTEGAFVLTFDDGFRGVREHALPTLEGLRWPFAVFVVSDCIGGEDNWTRTSNPGRVAHPLLTAEELLDLQRRGAALHSHTCSSPEPSVARRRSVAARALRVAGRLAAPVGPTGRLSRLPVRSRG